MQLFFKGHSGRAFALSCGVVALASGGVTARGAASMQATSVLPSAISVDADAQTAVLPLHRGTAHGKSVWYILTDASDAGVAKARRLVAAPILGTVGSGCETCVQKVTESGGKIAFAAAPDFSPARIFTPGPTGFPPKAAAPGGVGGDTYSPFVAISGIPGVLDAPIVATGDGPFDVTTHENTEERVLAIDTKAMTVKLLLVHGFANGKPVLYLSTEASDPGVASIERATYAPALKKATAGAIPIDVVANGPATSSAATSQGIAETALLGKLSADATSANAGTLRAPMNVLASFPTGDTAGAYSPLWSAQLGFWSAKAVAAKRNVQLRTTAAFDAAVAKGDLTGPGGKAFGPIGVVIDCPVIAYIGSSAP